jgi:hypothetical protein
MLHSHCHFNTPMTGLDDNHYIGFVDSDDERLVEGSGSKLQNLPCQQLYNPDHEIRTFGQKNW